MLNKYILIVLQVLVVNCVNLEAVAQHFKLGFDFVEYTELLKLTSKNSDLVFGAEMPYPKYHELHYRSTVTGLDNVWELWKGPNNTAVISVRGSTTAAESWVANFYAAMVPAKGILNLNNNQSFPYQLAENPQAAVHVGWLVAMAYMANDIVAKIDSCYMAGTRDFFIVGHSQGGGISFLLTAYLKNLQKQGKLASDVRFKTYCSAGPKPGNRFFADEYELTVKDGWAFNVVNVDDWVPEVPFSIQTINDISPTNPFSLADQTIKKQPLVKRMIFRKLYKKMTKPAIMAQKNYQKYLGKMVYKSVRKHLNDFSAPEYYNSNFYVRTGRTVLLKGSEQYYRKYPQVSDKFMTHHSFDAYLAIAEEHAASAVVE
jgi:pimeloyl-ACP methyl ester carboxylesterase